MFHFSKFSKFYFYKKSFIFTKNLYFTKILLFLQNLCVPISNQILYYTCCITLKRVTSWLGPSLCHCDQATQLISKKCCSGDELLATLCSIWPTCDLNLRPRDPEINVLLLDLLSTINHHPFAPGMCFLFLESSRCFRNSSRGFQQSPAIVQCT